MLTYLWSNCSRLHAARLRGTTVHASSRVHAGTEMLDCSVARHSFVGYDCTLLNVDIGPFCSLGSGIRMGGLAHPMQFVSTSPVFLSHKDSVKAKFARHDFLPRLRTRIGADVWIADGAYVKGRRHDRHWGRRRHGRRGREMSRLTPSLLATRPG